VLSKEEIRAELQMRYILSAENAEVVDNTLLTPSNF